MKKVINCLLLFSLAFNSFGQRLQTDSVILLVQQYFNEKKPDKIYQLTGEGFRKMITFQSFKSLAENQLLPLGEMQTPKFEKIANGVSIYKVVFTEATLAVHLRLDSSGKISTFLFQPYIDETPRKSEVPSSNPRSSLLDRKVDSIVVFHNGGIGGYRSYLAIHPTKKFAVVVLSNTSIGTVGIGNDIMRWLENKQE